jgi:tripartite-type tricarboxylate transporter receptor subunit TctC
MGCLRKIATSVLVLALFATLTGGATAQGFPSAPIRLVVPAAPGGSTDIIARSLAKLIQEQSGASVVVDNRAGAGGAIGAEAVARAVPDGHTLLMTVPDAITVLPHMRKDIPYQAFKDFTPIAMVAETSWVFAANPAVPVKDARDLAALAASKPGQVKYGSPGVGTSAHLITETFAQQARIDLLHVPYKGAGPAATAVVGREVEFIATSPIGVKSFVDQGRLKPLAITGSSRSSVMPDVPTLSESGFAGFEASAWFGVLAPAGLPAGRAERIEELVRAAARSPSFLAQLKQMGLEGRYVALLDFRRLLEADSVRWRDTIANLKSPVTQ